MSKPKAAGTAAEPSLKRTVIVQLLAIGLSVGCVVFFATWLYIALRDIQRLEAGVRSAQLARIHTFRLMLDEEAGVRGYAATRNRALLQPYAQAKPRFESAVSALATSLSEIGLPRTLTRRELQIERDYLRGVAEPLLSNPGRRDSEAVELRGKHLVDAFRTEDNRIGAALSGFAASVDASGKNALARGSIGSGMALLLAGFGVALFLRMQRRLTIEAAANRQAYEAERRVVETLQQAFMRKHLPNPSSARISARYAPATDLAKIGGDWFEAIERDKGRLLFSIGDVAGHGLDAAVVMSQVRQAIVAAALAGNEPGRVLSIANQVLLLQDAQIATAIFGYYDPLESTIAYASAGHPPPILHSASGAFSLPAGGVPLGVVEDADYQTVQALAPPGTALVLYTDGLIESRRDIVAGEAMLVQTINRVLGKKSIVDPAASIYDRMIPRDSRLDDVAVMVIKFTGNDVSAQRGTDFITPQHTTRIVHGNIGPREIRNSEPPNES